MTIDNVAKEAGVSKGGVLHHFKSKDELVRGMLEYFGTQAERALLERVAHDPVAKFRWARNMLGCMFPGEHPTRVGEGLTSEQMQPFMLAMITAAVTNPGVFEPLREVGKRLRGRLLSDPDDGAEQLLVWLAVDGLFLWQFLGLITRDDPAFAHISHTLLDKVSVAGNDHSNGVQSAGVNGGVR